MWIEEYSVEYVGSIEKQENVVEWVLAGTLVNGDTFVQNYPAPMSVTDPFTVTPQVGCIFSNPHYPPRLN